MVCKYEQMKEWFSLAKRNSSFSEDLFIEVMNQDPEKVKACATKEAKKLYRMDKAVSNEFHRLKGFIRLNISSHRILYAQISIEHRIIDILLLHFHSRFPSFHILLEKDNIVYGIKPDSEIELFYMNLSEALGILEKKLPQDPNLIDSGYEDNWLSYYQSQFISERKKRKFSGNYIPKRYRLLDDIRPYSQISLI
jgi:probable DNA metabolism protein